MGAGHFQRKRSGEVIIIVLESSTDVSLNSFSHTCDKETEGGKMISRCANPACNKPFHYLPGGRLYRFDSRKTAAAPKDLVNAMYTLSPGQLSVFFWLCQECSSDLSLRFDGRYVAVVPERVLGKDSNTPVIPVGRFDLEEVKLRQLSH
jgi:hypothetical protein